MRTSVARFVLFVLLAVPFATGKANENQAPSKQTIENLLAAWSSMDTTKIAPFYSPDPDRKSVV